MRMLATQLLCAAIVCVLALAPSGAAARPIESGKLARALATKLQEPKAAKEPRPQTHATDFGSDAIGCITLTSRELWSFGYRGHAFLCEEGNGGEVLGAVLSRSGFIRCYITGEYVGDGCYDFDICDIPETACVY